MKKLFALIVLVCLALLVCGVAAAENDGWTVEGTHLCYYKDGAKVTGTVFQLMGQSTILLMKVI